MGLRGPKPTPTAILKARGSWLAPRREKDGEPVVPEGEIERPKWLTPGGRKVWEKVYPVVTGMRVMTVADVNALGRYCNAQAKYQEEFGDLGVYELSTLEGTISKGEAKFGLTPADRARISKAPEKAKDGQNGKERFFKIKRA